MNLPGPGEPQNSGESQRPPAQPQPAEQYGRYDQSGQPGFPAQYHQPGYHGQPSGPNLLAILSLVFAFVFAPAGIVLGHLARRQIRQTGEQGAPLATWGLVLGYVFTALALVGCCGWLALVGWAGSEGDGGAY